MTRRTCLAPGAQRLAKPRPTSKAGNSPDVVEKTRPAPAPGRTCCAKTPPGAQHGGYGVEVDARWDVMPANETNPSRHTPTAAFAGSVAAGADSFFP